MKYCLCRLVLGLALVSLLGGSALAQGRVATIDLNKVFDNYWKTKQAQAVLKDRQADMEKELKNMLDDQKKAKEVYDKLVLEANDQAVSAEEREKRKTAAADKFKYLKEQEDTINQYGRQARVTLDDQGRRMRDNILGEIKTLVEGKAKAGGYGMVIDTSAESFNRTPIIMFSTKDNDVTDAILKELNAAAPADAGKSEAPKDEKSAKPEEKKDAKKK